MTAEEGAREKPIYASSPTEWGCFNQVKVMTQRQSELKGAKMTTRSLDDGSETKNGENDEINGKEDISRHSDNATKAADEEQRREEWAIAWESLALICLLQVAYILNQQPELRTRKQAGKGKRYQKGGRVEGR